MAAPAAAAQAGSRPENLAVYATGVVQGIVLVTFPAASTIFTERSGYGLSSTKYGEMFLPQVITAIATSLLGAGLARRHGTKRVYLAGLVASLVAMALLVVSQFADTDRALAYPILLLATACVGAGFGLTVPALNTFTAVFHPDGVDRAILVLNALLGLGTALAPVFVAVFVGLGFWWGLPVLSAALLAVLFLTSLRLPLRTSARQPRAGGAARAGVPGRFWLYAAVALLYGVCETMSGNWSQLTMTSHLGASSTLAALALTAFWAMVTLGRVVFAALQRLLPARWTYRLLPLVVAGAFALVLVLPRGTPALGVLAFGLAGLGCSALLPLTISFGQAELTGISASVAGGVIAFYQLGYGVAAFGVGPLQSAGVGLPSVFGLTAVVALVMGGLAAVLAHRQGEPTAVHPRPAHLLSGAGRG